MRALGIDVGVGKGLDVVLLDERLTPLRVVSRVGLERLGSLLDELHPDVVAIDAPPAWAPSGRSRQTERMPTDMMAVMVIWRNRLEKFWGDR